MTDLYPDNEPDDVAEFLAAIWGNGPHSLCWQYPGRPFLHEFSHSPTELLALVAELAPGCHVWLGAHPLKAAPEEGRGNGDGVVEVVALPSDLDWAHPTHLTPEPLPSETEVRDALRRLGPDLQPSVVVRSGHGLQPWWLLSKAVSPDEAAQLIAQLDAKLAEVGLEERTK